MPSNPVRINLTESAITFQSPFNPVFIQKIHQLPGSHWVPSLKGWSVPWSPLAAWLCLEQFPDPSCYAEQVYALLQQQSQDVTVTLPDLLYPFQATGVRFLVQQENAILADCPGSGKTLQAIVAAYHWGPVVISCPASVKYQWGQEILRVYPTATVEVVKGKKDGWTCRAEWTIMSRDIFTYFHKAIAQSHAQCLIVDEAHDFRNIESRRSQSMMAVATRMPHVFALTGTPIYNRVADLFPLLVATKQVRYKDYWFFLQRYCNGKKKPVRRKEKKTLVTVQADGLTNGYELRTFLSRSTLRRNRTQIERDLPPLTRNVLPVDLTNWDTYREEASDIAQWIRHNLEGVPYETRMIKINKLRRLAAIGKIEAVLERIRSLQEAEEKVVVLSSFLEPLDQLESNLTRTIRIDGNTSPLERQRQRLIFQEPNNNKTVALCSLEAGGIGITLTAAHHAFLLDIPWTPAQAQQGEARIYRETQTSPSWIHYVIGNQTIDHAMLSVLKRKAAWAKSVFEGGDDGFVDSIVEIERVLLQEVLKDATK